MRRTLAAKRKAADQKDARAQTGHAARRQALAQSRQSKARRVGDLTVTQTGSVREATANEYEKIFARVLEWESHHLGAVAETSADMDWVLTNLIDEWYLEGESFGMASKAVAATVFFRSKFGRGKACQLDGARQALRGWRRLEPPLSRLPLSWPILAMLINEMVRLGFREAGVVTALMFFTYFRPSEPFKLRVKDLVPPTPQAGGSHKLWSLTLHAFEGGQASKTQEFDEGVLLDRPASFFLGPVMQKIARDKKPSDLLFGITQTALGTALREAFLAVPSHKLERPTLYQVRHSGASVEFADKVRTLAEIQRRGRWRAVQSVRRYEKGPRVNEQLRKLEPRVRSFAVQCGQCVDAVLSTRRSPLEPPW